MIDLREIRMKNIITQSREKIKSNHLSRSGYRWLREFIYLGNSIFYYLLKSTLKTYICTDHIHYWKYIYIQSNPVGWGSRIFQLYLCRGIRLLQQVSWIWHYRSYGEAPVILELWGMRSTPLLPLFPGPLWPR